MLWVIAAVGIAAVGAVGAYVWQERLGARAAVPVALRAATVGALMLLIVNPRTPVPAPDDAVTVFVDASLSMGAVGGSWARAVDSAVALAGSPDAMRRIGETVEPWGTGPPDAGISRLDRAYAAARAVEGRAVVITDGEVPDPPAAGRPANTRTLVIARDTVPSAAVVDVVVPRHARIGDTVDVVAQVATWGALPDGDAALEVWSADARLVRQSFVLPPAPGRAAVRLRVPLGRLREGTHALRARVTAVGDDEPGDDARAGIVTVSDRPAVVVVIDPADWEGRFLARELAAVTRVPVRTFARVAADRWVDARTVTPVEPSVVRRAMAQASVVVTRGAEVAGTPRRWWDWPAGDASDARFVEGDWYVSPTVPASPLAGALAAVPWAELPPATGLLFRAGTVLGPGHWPALTAQRGRRGPERPLLVASDTAGGGRKLTTEAVGLWRWALRGGLEREAYRAMIAAGIDWLLAAPDEAAAGALRLPDVVARGVPVVAEWAGIDPPDTLTVDFVRQDTAVRRTLRFAAAGRAAAALDTGVYRWSAGAAGGPGTLVVEPYSSEIPPGAVTVASGIGPGRAWMGERPVRGRALWFVLVVALAVAEWAWRQRQGLA
jgi:hypothetical protein